MKNNWQTKKYKEVVTKVPLTGKKIKKGDYNENGKYPVIDQGQDLIGGYTNDNSKLIENKNGAVIFGDHTKVVKYISNDFAPGADGVKVLLPKGDILPKLLYYFSKAIQLPNKGYARHYQYLEKSDINIPPIDEQNQIVQNLDSLFSKIDSGEKGLKEVEKQLEVYRQAVLKKAFEGVDCKKTLKDLITVSRNGLSKRSGKEGEKIIVLRLADISEGKINNSSFRRIMMTLKEQKKYDLKKGDILFIRVNGSLDLVGRAILFNRNSKEIFSFCDHFIRIRLNNSINPKFMKYYFDSQSGRNSIMKIVRTTAGQNTINQGGLFSREIPLPNIQEQLKRVLYIEKHFSIINSIKFTLRKKVATSKKLRQSILKKAFNGELI